MAKVLEFQLWHHSFQRNPRADLHQNGLVGSPCSPRDSQESSGPITSWQIEVEVVTDFLVVLGSKITADGGCSHEIKVVCSLEGRLDNILKDKPRQHIKKQRHHFANKDP